MRLSLGKSLLLLVACGCCISTVNIWVSAVLILLLILAITSQSSNKLSAFVRFRWQLFYHKQLNYWLMDSGTHAKLGTLPSIAPLSPLCTRILGQNPGLMTLQGTNTYLLGGSGSNRRFLIDTGGGGSPVYLQSLLGYLESTQTYISDIFITHGHCDHIGGITDIQKAHVQKNRIVNVWKYLPGDADCSSHLSNSDAKIFNYKNIAHGQLFTMDGITLRAIYTPGHTNDHMCFFLEEEKVLFSGDCVLGTGSCVFQSFPEYMATLNQLLVEKASLIYPGHGPVVDNPEKVLKEYIAHRLKREQQIIKCIKDAGEKGLDKSRIVDEVYTNLPLKVRHAANKNIQHHLNKLRSDNLVVEYRGVVKIA